MSKRPRLILASASPRRAELLRALGVPFSVVVSGACEAPRRGESPRRFARRAAREKAEEVAARHPNDYVVSADTIVVAGGAILGKPRDRRDGKRMLELLAGRDHLVHTAVCLLRKRRGYLDEGLETTRVRFRPLSAEEIEGYLRTGETDDKAGAYAAQGAGSLLIERIFGSYTNVVGLPMARLVRMLLAAGVLAPARRGARWYRLAAGAG